MTWTALSQHWTHLHNAADAARLPAIRNGAGASTWSRSPFAERSARTPYNGSHFAESGVAKAPFFVRSLFDLVGRFWPHLEVLLHMQHTADRQFREDYRWSVLGSGVRQYCIATQAGALSGNVRVGLEDGL